MKQAKTMAGRMLRSFVFASLLSALRIASAADFKVSESELTKPVIVIAYGDMRFTDPSNTSATNPQGRRALVGKIASENPAAILLSGDLPWHGADKGDYAVYQRETQAWRARRLRIYPALGNHELNGDNERECLQNWWTTFPWLLGRRWYSVELGDHIYILNVDSNSSLLPGGAQEKWIERELTALPESIDFVFINLHHPPVSDYQENGDASHNVRPNELALVQVLKHQQRRSSARFVVTAGHVHNYERFLQDGTVYLVAGGGGAKPRPLIRAMQDLYQSKLFPNYGYVKFAVNGNEIQAAMYRLRDPEAINSSWDEEDRFQISSNSVESK